MSIEKVQIIEKEILLDFRKAYDIPNDVAKDVYLFSRKDAAEEQLHAQSFS